MHDTLEHAGKTGLTVLNAQPLVGETPMHLLDDDITPTNRMFIRNNGQLPEAISPQHWKLQIDGEVSAPLSLGIDDLRTRFPVVTLQLQMECGGNGRAFFAHKTAGIPWTCGGVSCANWTGVRLRDVLAPAQPLPSATHTAHYGADQAISRGIPLAKAMEEHTLIAFALNGEDLPLLHGAPARLVVPGWPGSVSQKWLTRIQLRKHEHDGAGMGGTSYRVPVTPLAPGTEDSGATFRNLESMPVRSILTNIAHGARVATGTLDIRGHAWAGEHSVRAVDVSTDYGATWLRMSLGAPANTYAWQHWSGSVELPVPGPYDIWVRATDSTGVMQPMMAGNWNPQGYGANPIMWVSVLVE